MLLAFQDASQITGDPLPIDGRAMLVAVIVIGLLAAASWALRRTTAFRRTRQTIAVETVVSLGERRSLAIVTIEGRRLLLGLTPASVALVTELNQPFDTALTASMQQEPAQ
jgi:flagellar biogenesis protein FliO